MDSVSKVNWTSRKTMTPKNQAQGQKEPVEYYYRYSTAMSGESAAENGWSPWNGPVSGFTVEDAYYNGIYQWKIVTKDTKRESSVYEVRVLNSAAAASAPVITAAAQAQGQSPYEYRGGEEWSKDTVTLSVMAEKLAGIEGFVSNDGKFSDGVYRYYYRVTDHITGTTTGNILYDGYKAQGTPIHLRVGEEADAYVDATYDLWAVSVSGVKGKVSSFDVKIRKSPFEAKVVMSREANEQGWYVNDGQASVDAEISLTEENVPSNLGVTVHYALDTEAEQSFTPIDTPSVTLKLDDNKHVLKVWVTDKAGNEVYTASVYTDGSHQTVNRVENPAAPIPELSLNVDLHRPSYKAVYSAEPVKTVDNRRYYNGPVELELKATEHFSAESTPYLTVLRQKAKEDGGAEEAESLSETLILKEGSQDTYEKTVTFGEDGDYRVTLYMKDEAGQILKDDANTQEGTYTYEFKIDTRAPGYEAQLKPVNEGTLERIVNGLTFGLFFNEKIQAEILLDDGALGSGVESVYYAFGGQKEAIPSYESIKEKAALTGDRGGQQKAVFIIGDAKDFTGSIFFYGADHAGNKTKVDTIAMDGRNTGDYVVVDRKAPSITITPDCVEEAFGAGESKWYRNAVTLTAGLADETAGLWSVKGTYRKVQDDKGKPVENPAEVVMWDEVYVRSVDRADQLTYEDSQTRTFTEDGIYEITVVLTDNAGNATTETYTVRIDKTAPDRKSVV